MNDFFKKVFIIRLQSVEERNEPFVRIKNEGYYIYKYFTEPMKYLEYVKEVEYNQQESYSNVLPDYARSSLDRSSNIEGRTQIMYFLEKDKYDGFPVLTKTVKLPVYVYKDINTGELIKFCLLKDFIGGKSIYTKPSFKTFQEANNWLLNEYPYLFKSEDDEE